MLHSVRFGWHRAKAPRRGEDKAAQRGEDKVARLEHMACAAAASPMLPKERSPPRFDREYSHQRRTPLCVCGRVAHARRSP